MRLHDYLDRIGLRGPAEPGVESLRRIHLAHRETFLFENLDIQNGRPILLDVPSLERKFLDLGRGGYCFEHNTLLASVLADLGLRTSFLLGRVRRGPPEKWVRTHMLLKVELESGPWIADVGFGAMGLLEPLPLAEGATASLDGLTYALSRQSSLWVLSMRDAAGQSDLYEFSEDPQTMEDVAMANHYTSTHPDSIFRRTLTIQRAGRDARVFLRGGILGRYDNGRLAEETVERERWSEVARRHFSVDLPEGPFLFERDSAAGGGS